MRLEKIKLSGFKSFVDPTTLSFNSDLVGIVGPNGCGKSNVIDAVRWVLGESSAKHLRGDQMADVIFNGSTTRKPVGQAFVELLFDNSDGTITGEFAAYRQIALKRQVNREGQSVYFLNGTRCRRKDITDLFLGTGLGPRSYAIIEQGTISRLVEAKPAELRVFLEEAAGISKYKERRRDTENRIRRTRDNLERISDLCEEIKKQCRHLKRQASTAERYKVLKAEERQLKAQLLALRWQVLDVQDKGQDKAIVSLELKVEESLAKQRELEKTIEQQREEHNTQQAKLSEVQAEFYAAGSEIAKVEQVLQHHAALKEQQEAELEQQQSSLGLLTSELVESERETSASKERIQISEGELAEAKKHEIETGNLLNTAEQALALWQKCWDDFTYQVAEPKRKIEIEKLKINQFDKELMQSGQRLSVAQNEETGLRLIMSETVVVEMGKKHGALSLMHDKEQHALMKNEEKRARLQALTHEESDALAMLRAKHSGFNGRLEAISVLQQSNRGDSHEAVERWLASNGLTGRAKLIENLDVSAGWEKAVETVLGARLQAVCVDDFSAWLAGDNYPSGELTLFNSQGIANEDQSATSLASLIGSKLPIMKLLKSIHYAEDLQAAKKLIGSLAEHESVITKDGVWLHVDSVSFSGGGLNDSMLMLEKERQDLTQKVKVLLTEIAEKERLLLTTREALLVLVKRGHELHQKGNHVAKEILQLVIQINEKKSKKQQASQRLIQLAEDINQAIKERENTTLSLARTKKALELAVEQSGQLETQRDELQQQRQIKRSSLDEARKSAHSSRELIHGLVLKIESQRSMQALSNQRAQVVKNRMLDADEKIVALQEQFNVSSAPVDEQKEMLEKLLNSRLSIEGGLVAVRSSTEATELSIRELETKRHQTEQDVQQVRENVSSAKVSHQEVRVRKQTLLEQMQETSTELDETLSHIPDNANDAQWQKQVDSLADKINGLGLINLTAIEEYEAQSERKEYLDSQLLDLTESLKILELAITKIDKESRLLFMQTFDKVNEGFEKRFPKLFGGGHAYLQQTGDNLLETGVTVMARPPGKRNSSIHLLSGGEKALTAVALVFAIFDLNPSPFCMLDEVDATLDEANVERFGELVKEMSKDVQMILITHNKATMEMTNQLFGVTMKEPGISRIVSVNLEEAAKMVANE